MSARELANFDNTRIQGRVCLQLHYTLYFPLLQKIVQISKQQVRQRTSLPFNTVILFVPQQEAWVIERFGKFHKTLNPVRL